jgi:hypothetical protein
MRSLRTFPSFLILAACLTLTACATNFSPELVRSEIARQRGVDPLSAFELSLGRFTTLMIKSALAGEDGVLPFAGLDSLEIAVYQAPNELGPAIDVTRIAVRGWEQVVRMNNPQRSGLVLIQPKRDSVGDLVVVGAGPNKVIYARLTGTLSRELPGRLGDVLREGGPDEVQRILTQLGES